MTHWNDNDIDHHRFRLGKLRESMSRNEPILSHNPSLGQVYNRGHSFPKSKTFTYGVKNVYEDGGVAKAMKHMPATNPYRKDLQGPKAIGRDFVALNRAAVTAGLTTAQENKQYRMTHDFQRYETKHSNKGNALKLPPDFTHGISYRPSTPVDKVISHQFQRKWLRDQLDDQNFRLERSKNEQKLQTGKAFENKASRLRRTTGLEKIYTTDSQLWQMPKFKTISPTVNSFRCDKQRSKSYANFKSEEKTKEGLYGQGIWTTGRSVKC